MGTKIKLRALRILLGTRGSHPVEPRGGLMKVPSGALIPVLTGCQSPALEKYGHLCRTNAMIFLRDHMNYKTGATYHITDHTQP